jgi:type III pantothenate kinase
LAAVVGAYRFFPNQNCLVIDAGTCITYDLLTAEKEYLGGNIAPGIGLRMRAMHEFTAKLPLIERGEQDEIWGISTETALRNGGQYGAAYEMQGFIDACEAKFGRMQVVLTGGDADFFGKALKTKIFVHPNLVLWGLLEILNYNGVRHTAHEVR